MGTRTLAQRVTTKVPQHSTDAAQAFKDYRALVVDTAAQLDPAYPIAADDLPGLSEADIRIILAHEPDLASNAFDVGSYVAMRNSAVHLTRVQKALAFWDQMERTCVAAMRKYLCSDVQVELASLQEPDDAPSDDSIDRAREVRQGAFV